MIIVKCNTNGKVEYTNGSGNKDRTKCFIVFFNRCATPIMRAPHKIPIPTRAGSLIQFLSIAYFTKKLIPSTRIRIPILLIRFSPMNFSISGFFSLNVCSQLFLGVKQFFLLPESLHFLVMVLPRVEVPGILPEHGCLYRCFFNKRDFLNNLLFFFGFYFFLYGRLWLFCNNRYDLRLRFFSF